LAVAFAIACFGTWLPVTPSGLGLSEGLMIPALIAVGSPRVAVALGVLTWRAIAYWMPIPIGATAYATHQVGRRRQRRRVDEADAIRALRPAFDLPTFADLAA
jgi:uncharacterized protein (TIRG00374 family)